MDIVGHTPNLTFGHYSGGTSMKQKYDAVSKGIIYSFHDTSVLELAVPQDI